MPQLGGVLCVKGHTRKRKFRIVAKTHKMLQLSDFV